MQLEQRIEQSEALLEKNEGNKRNLAQAERQLQQAGKMFTAAQTGVRQSQAQVQQALAAQRQAKEAAKHGEQVDLQQYEDALIQARERLSIANSQMQVCQRARDTARENVSLAERELGSSTQALQGVISELDAISQKYGIQLGNTQRLLSMNYGELANPLLQQMEMGRQHLDNLRQRICNSLGISMTSYGASGSAAVAAGGGRGARGRVRSIQNDDTVHRNTAPIGNGANNTATTASGSSSPAGSASPTGNSAVTILPMGLPSRALNDSERQSIQKATGWTDKQMNKCTIDDNGVIHYKTDNSSKEGTKSKTGVPYVRKQVQISGYTVEGVFPVFESYGGIEAQLPSNSLTESNYNQFKECNKQLRETLKQNSELQNMFTEEQLSEIFDDNDTPTGFVWHHNEEEGRMQLVLLADHDRTQGGAAHTGGDALWGGKGDDSD